MLLDVRDDIKKNDAYVWNMQQNLYSSLKL